MEKAHDPYDGFEDWEDVRRHFEMDEKEPTEVILARYDQECYEGSALVIYRRGRRYYEVSGGHCSCHGLEGQWDPEEYTRGTFRKVLNRRLNSEYSRHEWAPIITRIFGDKA